MPLAAYKQASGSDVWNPLVSSPAAVLGEIVKFELSSRSKYFEQL
jgi:hypothetical protein